MAHMNQYNAGNLPFPQMDILVPKKKKEKALPFAASEIYIQSEVFVKALIHKYQSTVDIPIPKLMPISGKKVSIWEWMKEDDERVVTKEVDKKKVDKMKMKMKKENSMNKMLKSE